MKVAPIDWIEKIGDAGINAFFGFLKVSITMFTASFPVLGLTFCRTV